MPGTDNNTALSGTLPFYRMATVTGLVSCGGLWSDADAARAGEALLLWRGGRWQLGEVK